MGRIRQKTQEIGGDGGGKFLALKLGEIVVIRVECGMFGTLSQQSLEIWK
jgi:hypothetical protein